jgi:hypothetical protein
MGTAQAPRTLDAHSSCLAATSHDRQRVARLARAYPSVVEIMTLISASVPPAVSARPNDSSVSRLASSSSALRSDVYPERLGRNHGVSSQGLDLPP